VLPNTVLGSFAHGGSTLYSRRASISATVIHQTNGNGILGNIKSRDPADEPVRVRPVKAWMKIMITVTDVIQPWKPFGRDLRVWSSGGKRHRIISTPPGRVQSCESPYDAQISVERW
jgi:hypothetical protein